jgi:hypothetical protein
MQGFSSPAAPLPLAVAAGLLISTQPAGATDNIAFTTQPAVQLVTAGGQFVAQGGVTITAAIQSGSGSLIGTATAITTSAGLATWATLGIDATSPPSNFTLRFSASGLTTVDSSSFSLSAGSGLWPNEPGLATIKTDWDPTGSFPNAGWATTNSNNAMVTSQDGPASPPNAMQTTFPTDTPPDNGPGTAYLSTSFGPRLYIGYYIKLEAGMTALDAGMKLHGIISNSGPFVFGFLRSGTPPYNLGMIVQWDPYGYDNPPAESDGGWPGNLTQTPIVPDTWYLFEFYYDVTGGRMSWWVNNVQQALYTSVNYTNVGNGWQEAQFSWTRQFPPSTVKHIWIDHVLITSGA